MGEALSFDVCRFKNIGTPAGSGELFLARASSKALGFPEDELLFL